MICFMAERSFILHKGKEISQFGRFPWFIMEMRWAVGNLGRTQEDLIHFNGQYNFCLKCIKYFEDGADSIW